jgi:hypothetical protein
MLSDDMSDPDPVLLFAASDWLVQAFGVGV